MTHPHEYHWVFSSKAHIEFPNGGDPVPAAPSHIDTLEGLSTISDSSGALLMYTDGHLIWDGSLTTAQFIASALGGNYSSTHSAIIVPPAGIGGVDYHVFAVGSDNDLVADKVFHSTYRPGSGTIAQIIQPHPVSDIISTTYDNTERLAAISHAECDKYWVILQDGNSANLHALLVESDSTPTTVVTSTSSLQQFGAWEAGYMKFSPDGTKLAYADTDSHIVVLLAFDNATGLFTDLHQITDAVRCYGIEFSPDSQSVYISSDQTNDVRAHTVANGTQSFGALTVVSSGGFFYALQLAPNGKIYGKPDVGTNMLEIGQPNTPLTPAVVQNATYADGSVMNIRTAWNLGLPTFTRITDACSASEQLGDDNDCDVGSAVNCVFPWTTGSILEPMNSDYPNFSAPEVLTQQFSLANWAGTDGIAYNGLTPWHRTARLLELSFLKLPLPVGYIGGASLDLVVLDYAGTVLRTISTTTLNLLSLTDYSWTPISLSTVAGDLDILAGEVVAGQLTMDIANTSLVKVTYQLSGTGQFI